MAKAKARARKDPPKQRRGRRAAAESAAARLKRQLAEARAQQAATAAILKVIRKSLSDSAPVFDSITRSAAKLCGAPIAAVIRAEAGMLHLTSIQFARAFGPFAKLWPMPIERGGVQATVVRERKLVNVGDVRTDARVAVWARPLYRKLRIRSGLWVPMISKAGVPGLIVVFHSEANAFDARKESLLRTFADQAVIAIENARLFNETKEALERQTATAEILKVIASSPAEVQPVFDAIVQTAKRLIDAFSATVTHVGDGMLHLVAHTATTPQGAEALNRFFPIPVEGTPMGRAILSRRPQFVDDFETGPGLKDADRDLARSRGFRSVVFVPLMRGNVAIGSLNVTRREAGRMTEHQLDLLKTFADQAVIAIENVRLFNETKEALERQTATAEILGVIASSPANVQPVFDAMLRSAVSLCGAEIAAVFPYDGNLVHLGATFNWSKEALEYFSGIYPSPPSPTLMSGRTILSKSIVTLSDAAADEHYDADSAATGHWRRMIGVPMLREGRPLGALVVCWREPGVTPQRQVDLLQTFADQAVIAIENVRLFNETKEALERQTATAAILEVIANSRTEVQPVFDAIVQSAARLFGRTATLRLIEPEGLRRRALSEAAETSDQPPELMPLNAESLGGRVALEGRPRQVVDTRAPDAPPYARMHSHKWNFRANASAPLMREGKAIGTLNVSSPQPGALSEKQMELLSTFANQAVIAIDNVRLFNETKEALEKQTATADILQVLSGSPSDTQPVFEAIVRHAARLCEATYANVFRYDGERIHLAASQGGSPEALAALRASYPAPPSRTRVVGRVIESGLPAHVEDTLADADYDQGFAGTLKLRRLLGVPLLRAGRPVGAITVGWAEPGPIRPRHEDLLKTFADQAVIAIENVRLFNETKEALERQTATAEILKVIASSPSDVQPVFDAIVNSVAHLFEPCSAGIVMREGNLLQFYGAAGPRMMGVNLEEVRRVYPIAFDPERSASARAIVERRVIEILDTNASEVSDVAKNVARAAGYRSVTTVPLIREGEGIGTIGLTNPEPGFRLNEKQLALMRTFADQAVIAIENVRLFKELQQRTDALTKSVGQLTALGEVGQAISSTLDLETVLKTIVSRAVLLTGLDVGSIYEYDENTEEFSLKAAENMPPEMVDAVRVPIRKGDGTVGGTALTREAAQVPDILDESYRSSRKDVLIEAGYRAILTVPLLHEDRVLGALSVTRRTPGEFPPEVVELLKTFATQSAMAIQNARLFREIAEKGKQLEVASRHKSDFLASMSHELRTPLNAILGFNEMILGQVYGEVPADMQEPLTDIQTSGKHLLRLINNVLDLAKIEAGRMELSLSDYSVHDTVESVRATLRPLAAEKGLEFHASVPADLPLAYGDAGRIAQCLMNLAGNSLKFTKAGKVEIVVVPRDEILVFRVADTGIGIPPDKIAVLFTEFRQTDATIASEYGGTGLGLSISKKFVEMHGGRIWVESEIGKGSTFIFEIPLRVNS